jgi:HSP20 family molecular chaperone IbpA
MNQMAQTNGDPAKAEAMNAGPIFAPATDIIEKSDRMVMLLDLPGAEPTSLDVTLEKRVLTISARITSTVPEGYAPAYVEFQDGTYERRFVFSEAMDSDHIDAALKDGVLRLTIPRSVDSGAKKIDVKTV